MTKFPVLPLAPSRNILIALSSGANTGSRSTSVLILIAILGAVVLASRPEAIARRHHGTETPKSEPELVGAGKEH